MVAALVAGLAARDVVVQNLVIHRGLIHGVVVGACAMRGVLIDGGIGIMMGLLIDVMRLVDDLR